MKYNELLYSFQKICWLFQDKNYAWRMFCLIFVFLFKKLIYIFIIEITECLPVRTARRFFPHNCLLTNNKRDSRE